MLDGITVDLLKTDFDKKSKNRIFLEIIATPTRMQEAEQIKLYKMFDYFDDMKGGNL